MENGEFYSIYLPILGGSLITPKLCGIDNQMYHGPASYVTIQTSLSLVKMTYSKFTNHLL